MFICAYCGQNWHEDKRGGCSACGAPGSTARERQHHPIYGDITVYATVGATVYNASSTMLYKDDMVMATRREPGSAWRIGDVLTADMFNNYISASEADAQFLRMER